MTVELRLRAATPPHWLQACQQHLPQLLSDHAHCERKAAASALSMISRVPHDVVTVRAMAALAREESGHLSRVHNAIVERGWTLLPDGKDPYVLGLRAHIVRGREEQLLDELCVCALIELRSAERLSILSTGLVDEDLRRLYRDLATAEDGHASLFIERARFHASATVEHRLDRWLDREAAVVNSLPGEPRIHG